MVIMVKKWTFQSTLFLENIVFRKELVTTKILSSHTLKKVNSWSIWRRNSRKIAIFDQKFDLDRTITRPRNYQTILFFDIFEKSRQRRFEWALIRGSKSTGSLFSEAMTINLRYQRLKFSDSRFLARYPIIRSHQVC